MKIDNIEKYLKLVVQNISNNIPHLDVKRKKILIYIKICH